MACVPGGHSPEVQGHEKIQCESTGSFLCAPCSIYTMMTVTHSKSYDHLRQCIHYRYYYIYETAKLYPIGNIYPNIVNSTTNDQIEPDYEAIER